METEPLLQKSDTFPLAGRCYRHLPPYSLTASDLLAQLILFLVAGPFNA